MQVDVAATETLGFHFSHTLKPVFIELSVTVRAFFLGFRVIEVQCANKAMTRELADIEIGIRGLVAKDTKSRYSGCSSTLRSTRCLFV